MISNILHTGVVHVSTILPSDNTVIISILDNNSKIPRPDFTGFKDTLLLSFKDRCEEDYKLKWKWPDEIPENQFVSYSGFPHERLCNLSDANKIIKFFYTHHVTQTPTNLVIHCKSGVGRSAAIALWLGMVFKIRYSGTDPRGRFYPNLRVVRMLNKAYENRVASQAS